MLRVRPQVRVDSAEGYPHVDRQFFKWKAFFVKKVEVSRIDQLDACVSVQIFENFKVFFH